ncbi:MAG: hypothetical protein DRG76_10585, partial [Deltaproteobacteria bacterium]
LPAGRQAAQEPKYAASGIPHRLSPNRCFENAVQYCPASKFQNWRIIWDYALHLINPNKMGIR